ncbi:hypothetical protein EIN_371910 [Entamoeba invadens IP1]|uniref:Uncharacterized protein n=1 Tax=Entamoeba invadens IP1 TaxID=370355 RepID=A0A0A1UFM6_ENTIV|nr:hypothetical protein EIN_371910 [Entamoeba invadens IP1]ELP92769.1 hypothetical protein EIN_371910 [Entamoeba invadens IP1]|eukprot:XP_004259540.1 hypothetical protein EIN_371910 [Entamoeba invadens IP1]
MCVTTFISKHLFLFFVVPQLVMVFYALTKIGLNECYADREAFKMDGIFALLNPYNWTLVISVLIIGLSCLRKKADGTLVFVVNTLNQFLNGYMFHRSIYYFVGCFKVFLNDKTCSVGNKKLNGISGHFFTAVYFMAIFIRLIKQVDFLPKTSSLVSFEIPRDKTSTFRDILFHMFRLDVTGKGLQKFVLYCLLLSYYFVCLATTCLTLFHGYHTPLQVIYGIFVGIISILVYAVFLWVPFKYRSFINLFLIVLAYSLFCIVSGYHMRFSYFYITGGVAVVLTGVQLLTEAHKNAE